MLRRHLVVRQVHSVPCSNYIWHIDRHHKVIRWRFVISGGVDGVSRCTLFLICSDNNHATTIHSLFTAGVSQFGLPDRVRSDHGGENIKDPLLKKNYRGVTLTHVLAKVLDIALMQRITSCSLIECCIVPVPHVWF